ncbi:endoplasmic oxidoreductin-1 [Sorochytrium milnesiophthora]
MKALLVLAVAALAATMTTATSPLSAPGQPCKVRLLIVFASEASTTNLYGQLRGKIEDACCEYGTTEVLNESLWPTLEQIVRSSFFRFVKVDLNKKCPFWSSEAQCLNEGCSIDVMSDTDLVPEARYLQRSHKLADVSFPSSSQLRKGGPLSSLISISEKNDKDFCVVDDEDKVDGQYIDLLANPERFTGYSGPSARGIWEAIYNENCFGVPEQLVASSALSELGAVEQQGSSGGVCLEKRVFYRIISGLHTSISTHICAIYPDTTQAPLQWGRNLTCFVDRVGQWPNREQNLYFNYAILLRAVRKLGPYLMRYDYNTGNADEQRSLKAAMEKMTSDISACQETFDETHLFFGPGSQTLRREIQERFTNISRIMDCVSCQKCRLWGKAQITGIGTALKVLFTLDRSLLSPDISTPKPVLSRWEVVALLNTLARFAESIREVQHFRQMMASSQSPLSSSSSPKTSTPQPTATPPTTTTTPSTEAPAAWRGVADDDKDDQDEDNTAAVCSKGVAHKDTDVLAKIALNVDAAGGGTDMSDKDVYNNRVTHDQHRHNAHGGRSTHDDKMAAVQMDGNNADDADAPQDKDTDKDKGALAKDATQNDDNNTGGSALAQHETRVGAAAFDPPEHLPIEARRGDLTAVSSHNKLVVVHNMMSD